jgi:hypothetical protein
VADVELLHGAAELGLDRPRDRLARHRRMKVVTAPIVLQRLNELASGQDEKTLAAMVKMAEIITERSSSRE